MSQKEELSDFQVTLSPPTTRPHPQLKRGYATLSLTDLQALEGQDVMWDPETQIATTASGEKFLMLDPRSPPPPTQEIDPFSPSLHPGSTNASLTSTPKSSSSKSTTKKTPLRKRKSSSAILEGAETGGTLLSLTTPAKKTKRSSTPALSRKKETPLKLSNSSALTKTPMTGSTGTSMEISDDPLATSGTRNLRLQAKNWYLPINKL